MKWWNRTIIKTAVFFLAFLDQYNTVWMTKPFRVAFIKRFLHNSSSIIGCKIRDLGARI